MPRYPIESVDKALTLLLSVARSGRIGVSEAGRQLGVAPSTAHRLLDMLQHHGFVEPGEAAGTYKTGPQLMDLWLTALRGVDVRSECRPHLERLVAEVGETAHLTLLRNAGVVFLDCVECSAPIRATPRTGQMLPAHCTAAGKAALAALEPELLRSLYPADELVGMTPGSHPTYADLVSDLDEIRVRGFALNDGESESDLSAVAVLIRDPRGMVRGAFTVAGPPQRMTRAVIRRMVPPLQAAAAAAGARLP